MEALLPSGSLLEQGLDQSGPDRMNRAGCAAFVSLSSQMIALSGVPQGALRRGVAAMAWACRPGGLGL